MAEDVIAVNVIARDGASATLARVSKETRILGGSATAAGGPIGKLGAATGGLISPMTLGVGAAAALGYELASMTKAAIEDEQSQALLKASLEANIPAYEGNSDAIEKVIESRLRLGFADDVQREGLRQLLAVTQDETAALELQRTAMDFARLRGIDLTAASTLLGKVYGGNVGILARYGIQLDKGTTSTEAIAEIQRRATGQAEAYADTTAGAAEAAGIAWGEFEEVVGHALLDAADSFAQFALDAGNSLHQAGEDFADFAHPVLQWLYEIHTAQEETTAAMIATAEKSVGYTSHMTEAWATAWGALAGTVTTEGGFIVTAMTDTAEDGVAGAVGKFGKLPQLAGDAIHDAQFHFNDAVDDLKTYMENYLTPKQETLRLQGFISSQAVADGLASGEPVIVRKTKRLVAAAEAELEKLNGWSAGSYAAQTYINGMAEGIRAGVGTIGDALYYLKVNSIGGSLPKSGPMSGPEIDKGAHAIADRFTGSLAGGLRGGTVAVQGGLAGNRGAGGGTTIIFQSTLAPTPSQAAELARVLTPALERERRRQS